MTKEESRILSSLARSLRLSNPMTWSELKQQTQIGPEFAEFPYFPAALELENAARRVITALVPEDKDALLEAWHSKLRYLRLDQDEEILRQYAVVLVDLIVQRARHAAARSNSW